MRKISYLSLLPCLIILALLSSCVNQKQIAYFQKDISQSDTLSIPSAYVPKIQIGDILVINIGSLNTVASSFFNPYSTIPSTTETLDINTGTSSSQLNNSASPGYLIGADGTIDLPLIGNIKLSGLTTLEAKMLIKAALKKYLKEPFVNVRFVNYKISIIGEVVKPSTYIIPNEKITLPEAISLAGDLTIFGKRSNIMVIRDVEGKKVFGRVNLNSRDIYSSPYYYLHNNDVVYVEPNKARSFQVNGVTTILPIGISILSLIYLILRR